MPTPDSYAVSARGVRPRVLISAYACGPGDESEANAGWAFTEAAAAEHDVWLVTRERFRVSIDEALSARPQLAAHLVVTYLELSSTLMARKRRGADVYWYYILWQRKLGHLAAAMHAELGFDVAHHVSFAVDWLPCGLRGLADRVPLVWGPVGGATYAPLRLARWFNVRALASDVGRAIATRAARRVFGDPVARRARIVVAQNDDVAHRFRRARRVVVEPNSALDEAGRRLPRVERASVRRAIYIGRLVAWKGPMLAVHAMAEPAAADWALDIYGDGVERARLHKAITELGLADRVSLRGQRPRDEVLLALRTADAMLFPSMHDSAPWAVAEASAAGCPVVCLAKGGPPLLAGPNGFVVQPERHVVRRLAIALQRAGKAGGVRYDRWLASRLPAIVSGWYRDAMTP